jgi:hypothetical protein
MQFVRRDVWHVTFLEPGLQKSLPKTLTFKDEGKIREPARHAMRAQHRQRTGAHVARLLGDAEKLARLQGTGSF